MKTPTKLLLTSAICTVCALPTAVDADTTVTTHTYVETQDIEGANKVDFTSFDINKDGLYAKTEVGEKLFYLFDLDGNEVIDNIEWDKTSVYTIVPMEKETFTFVDYNSDGYTELSAYDYDQFYKESALILFDQNKNGLSASEFIGETFLTLDDNDSGMIELDEWKEAYIQMVKPASAEQERYN